jgi:hypothetical protein
MRLQSYIRRLVQRIKQQLSVTALERSQRLQPAHSRLWRLRRSVFNGYTRKGLLCTVPSYEQFLSVALIFTFVQGKTRGLALHIITGSSGTPTKTAAP